MNMNPLSLKDLGNKMDSVQLHMQAAWKEINEIMAEVDDTISVTHSECYMADALNREIFGVAHSLAKISEEIERLTTNYLTLANKAEKRPVKERKRQLKKMMKDGTILDKAIQRDIQDDIMTLTAEVVADHVTSKED
jgi:uncharacterized coiled-coil DUF342 family protein